MTQAPPAAPGQDATNTTISNSSFSNIDAKGVYMETAQGNTNLTGLTMNDVGQYGGVPSFGTDGKNGNSIDINLKYQTYTGNLDIRNFNLTNTGTSDGGATPTGPSNESGAIVIEARDDPSSYNTIPADASGLNVTVLNGTINGTSIGVRAGEMKASPSQNDTGPAVTVNNVAITNTTVGAIDNQTDSLMTVNGTGNGDDYVSPLMPGSTGSLDINESSGNNTLGGGLGNDVINGGSGNDTLLASGGDDVLNGGGGNNTADFSQATSGVNVSLQNSGLQNLGDFGEVTLSNIQNLTGSNYSDVLTGDANNNILEGGPAGRYAGRQRRQGSAGRRHRHQHRRFLCRQRRGGHRQSERHRLPEPRRRRGGDQSKLVIFFCDNFGLDGRAPRPGPAGLPSQSSLRPCRTQGKAAPGNCRTRKRGRTIAVCHNIWRKPPAARNMPSARANKDRVATGAMPWSF